MIEKTIINSNDDMSKNLLLDLTLQKEKLDKENELLLENPTLENMQSYQSIIKEFVSLTVTKMYEMGIKSNWQNIPRKNLYAKVNAVDTILNEINKCVNNGDRENLKKQCEQVTEILIKLTSVN